MSTQPAGVYEAEDATLVHVGIEARHAGFEGWGYVAGWGSKGQAVGFTVKAPSAGRYSLALRYASTGDAKRSIVVRGKTTGTASFKSTGGYAKYETVTVTAELPAGESSLALTYDAGSHGYLNLDRLTVSK